MSLCEVCDNNRRRRGGTEIGQACAICDGTGTDYIGRACPHASGDQPFGARPHGVGGRGGLATKPNSTVTVPHHAFFGVAGHPDDDECTHRQDGTDDTYCGLPLGAHPAGRHHCTEGCDGRCHPDSHPAASVERDVVRGVERFVREHGEPQVGRPAGLLLRQAQYADLRRRLDAGEILFVRSVRPSPPPTESEPTVAPNTSDPLTDPGTPPWDGQPWTFHTEYHRADDPGEAGVPDEHWTWELCSPDDIVRLSGTDTSDPRFHLSRIAVLLGRHGVADPEPQPRTLIENGPGGLTTWDAVAGVVPADLSVDLPPADPAQVFWVGTNGTTVPAEPSRGGVVAELDEPIWELRADAAPPKVVPLEDATERDRRLAAVRFVEADKANAAAQIGWAAAVSGIFDVDRPDGGPSRWGEAEACEAVATAFEVDGTEPAEAVARVMVRRVRPGG